jgi:hypothetical protein
MILLKLAAQNGHILRALSTKISVVVKKLIESGVALMFYRFMRSAFNSHINPDFARL